MWHNTNSGVLGRNVKSLIDRFKACIPEAVVKGTPHSLCICGDKIQHTRDHSGWCVWSCPHLEHWELPPRDNWDRGNSAFQFPNGNMAHWGESYWGKRWIERESLVSRLEKERYDEEAQSCETHSPIQLINIVTHQEGHVVRHGPRVNAEEDQIQRLLGNA